MASEDKYYIIDGTLVHADQVDELYHSGRVGMKWGKHLPGTTWWKEDIYAKGMRPSAENYDPSASIKYRGGNSGKANPSIPNKYTTQALYRQTARARLGAGHGGRSNSQIVEDGAGKGKYHTVAGRAGQAARNAGSSVSNAAKRAKFYATNSNARSWVGKSVKSKLSSMWNTGKGYATDQINKFKDSARQAYAGVRDMVHKFFETGNKNYRDSKIENTTALSHLEQLIKKEQREAAHSYVTSKVKGGVGNTINSFIQSAQMRVAMGVNNFLNNIGMSKQVDKFLSKFMGNSKKITAQNNVARYQTNKTNSGYNRAEANMQPTSSLPRKKIKGSTKSARTQGYGTRV